ncbi:MAG: hypothetical protein BWK73_09180 [Thiothrix lacustris]|uniref:Uncharacterized protein n=1 Tax=Thiothrix lacustris TaxID=525917 RepID=A0A1Y1QVN3_9GAMM|nr:MAG: hypothetical protein BWK73_09180 [Thiothrix lacustris]
MHTTKQKSIMENVANYAAAGATAIFLLAITSGLATAEDVKKHKVYFFASLNERPAAIAVSWTVTGKDFVANDKRHQFLLMLMPGTYSAKLVCNGKTKTTSFPVVERENPITIIPTKPQELNINLSCD